MPTGRTAEAAGMKRNVWLLFACQALTHATMSGQATMAALPATSS